MGANVSNNHYQSCLAAMQRRRDRCGGTSKSPKITNHREALRLAMKDEAYKISIAAMKKLRDSEIEDGQRNWKNKKEFDIISPQ